MEPYRFDDLEGWRQLLGLLRAAMRRVLISLLILAIALAAAQGTGTALARHKPKRHHKTTTITRSFTETDGSILLRGQPVAIPFPSTVEVRGFTHAKIVDVNLVLHNVEAEQPDDLDLFLIAPDLRHGIIAMSDVGGTDSVQGLMLTFDDQAGQDLPDAGTLTSGRFRPTNVGSPDPELDTLIPGLGTGPSRLSTFNGLDPNGLWSLVLFNDQDEPTTDAAILEGWTLTIKAQIKSKN